jgi:hypothetical protein
MRIALNLHKRDNYAFFCPQTRVHLTVDNPVANIDRVSPAIERGLKSKSLIDLDKAEEQIKKSRSVERREALQSSDTDKEAVKEEANAAEALLNNVVEAPMNGAEPVEDTTNNVAEDAEGTENAVNAEDAENATEEKPAKPTRRKATSKKK